MRISDWSSDVCSSDLIAALDLAQIDRLVDRAAAIVQQVGAQQPVFAGERIDRRLGHRGAAGEIVDRPAARPIPVPPDLRRAVEAGGGERDAVRIGQLHDPREREVINSYYHNVVFKHKELRPYTQKQKSV